MARSPRKTGNADNAGRPLGEPAAVLSGSELGAEGADAFAIIDPVALPEPDGSAAASVGGAGRKRGRPAGAGNRAKTAAVDVNGVESILFSIHLALASLTSTPELTLDPAESKALAQAAANVARHYDMPGMSQVMVDWGNLIVVAATCYGSRLMAVRLRHAKEAEARKAARVGNDASVQPLKGENPAFMTMPDANLASIYRG